MCILTTSTNNKSAVLGLAVVHVESRVISHGTCPASVLSHRSLRSATLRKSDKQIRDPINHLFDLLAVCEFVKLICSLYR